MDPERRMRAEQLLRPGERLLWAGMPDPAVRFTPADRFLIPFSIMWGGFALFWEGGVITTGAPFFFKLWGIPFVAMGAYFVAGRFVVKARRKRETLYVLTDRRAVVAMRSSVSEAPWKGQPRQVSRTGDGAHVTVSFGNPQTTSPWGRSAGMYANTGMDFFGGWGQGQPGVAFYDVADAEALMSALDSGDRPTAS